MIPPTQVSHSKFPVLHHLYDDGEFAIAWGPYDGGPERIGMRWSGDPATPTDVGYPKLFSNPVWFMLPEALSVSIAKGLVGAPNADQVAVLQVLEALRASGALQP
jgi:hypothetical protein